jgi:hypothetical protein
MIRDIDTPFIEGEAFNRVINDWLYESTNYMIREIDTPFIEVEAFDRVINDWL